jgi:hypothetical protein
MGTVRTIPHSLRLDFKVAGGDTQGTFGFQGQGWHAKGWRDRLAVTLRSIIVGGIVLHAGIGACARGVGWGNGAAEFRPSSFSEDIVVHDNSVCGFVCRPLCQSGNFACGGDPGASSLDRPHHVHISVLSREDNPSRNNAVRVDSIIVNMIKRNLSVSGDNIDKDPSEYISRRSLAHVNQPEGVYDWLIDGYVPFSLLISWIARVGLDFDPGPLIDGKILAHILPLSVRQCRICDDANNANALKKSEIKYIAPQPSHYAMVPFFLGCLMVIVSWSDIRGDKRWLISPLVFIAGLIMIWVFLPV